MTGVQETFWPWFGFAQASCSRFNMAVRHRPASEVPGGASIAQTLITTHMHYDTFPFLRATPTTRRSFCVAGALLLVGCAGTAPDRRAGAAAELGATGKLRAAINFGNPILASKNADGEPQGVSVDLAREAARRLGLPIELVLFNSAGTVVEAVKARQVDLAFVAIDPVRARGHGLHRALRDHRRRLHGAQQLAAATQRGSGPRRHARRRRPRQRLRPVPHARAEVGDAGACADLARGHRPVPRPEPRSRRRRASSSWRRTRSAWAACVCCRAASW